MHLLPQSKAHWTRLGLLVVVPILICWITILWMTSFSRPTRTVAPAIADPLLESQLEEHVRMLASSIGARSVFLSDSLERAGSYLESQAAARQLVLTRQTYDARGYEATNFYAEIGGSGPTLIIGAHYDSTAGTPGADDNASGVAVLLEIIPLLMDRDPGNCSITVAFFANEEPPFFQTDEMGSRVFARSLDKEIIGMISVESVGYLSNRHDQNAPWPLGLFFPRQGDFVAFVGNIASRGFLAEVLDSFRAVSPVPTEAISTFESVEGVGWSDHWSFWQEGVPAIMISDTAPFRNPHYHQESDQPDTLNYVAMSQLVAGLAQSVIDVINQRPECGG